MFAGEYFVALLIAPALLMGMAVLGLGLAAILRRKPLVVSARGLFWVFAIAVLLALAPMLSMAASTRLRGALGVFPIFQGLILVLLLLFLWRTMQGYLVLGVREQAFRDAMLGTLAALGLDHQESLIGFNLPGLNDALQATVQGWVGSAQIRMRSRGHGEDLRKIARSLRVQFDTMSGATHLLSPTLYAAMGVLMIALAVFLAVAL